MGRSEEIFLPSEPAWSGHEMPEICRFYGLVMVIYWNDHNPPHFHARYGDEVAEIEIRTLAMLRGSLAPRALALMIEWASQHQPDLMHQWNRARRQLPLQSIKPLP